MTKRHYPFTGDWQLQSTEVYTGVVGMKCARCPHRFGKREKFWRRETQVNWFRGDDESEDVCNSCHAAEVMSTADRGKP